VTPHPVTPREAPLQEEVAWSRCLLVLFYNFVTPCAWKSIQIGSIMGFPDWVCAVTAKRFNQGLPQALQA